MTQQLNHRGPTRAWRGLALIAVLILGLLLTTLVAPSSAVSPQPAARPAGKSVQVATWNFCNHTCRDYDRRLGALVRTLAATRPDVLALQEVATGDALQQVADRLAGIGYRNASGLADSDCEGRCESHVFVREATMSVLGTPQETPAVTERCRLLLDDASFRDLLAELRESGGRGGFQQEYRELFEERDACRTERPVRVADPHRGTVTPGQLARRAYGNPIGYAVVAPRSGGQSMLVASLHFEKQNGSTGHGADDRVRNATASGLARWARARAAELGRPRMPIILAGDYNAYLRKHPRGPQALLQRMGFRNADTARVRVGSRYATINKYPLDAKWDGFPPRPRQFVLGGPQIDTIMTTGLGRALRHEIHVRTTRDGRFDERFRASDHNLVRAWFRIG